MFGVVKREVADEQLRKNLYEAIREMIGKKKYDVPNRNSMNVLFGQREAFKSRFRECGMLDKVQYIDEVFKLSGHLCSASADDENEILRTPTRRCVPAAPKRRTVPAPTAPQNRSEPQVARRLEFSEESNTNNNDKTLVIAVPEGVKKVVIEFVM